MRVVIPSVEHTGSRLVANHIFYHYATSWHDESVDHDCKYYDHVNAKNIEFFVAEAKANPTIVPLRHPIRCAYSWEQRPKPLDGYFKQWDLMIDQIDAISPMYLRVDSELRNEDLSVINESYGLKLETFWPYVGERLWPWVSERKPGIIPLEECKLANEAKVLNYIDANKAFFGRFYDC